MKTVNALNAKSKPEKYLVVRAGPSTIAMPLLGTKEVAKIGKFSPLPDVPAVVRGVTNIRGQMVVMIDLSLLVKISSSPQGDLADKFLVVVEDRELTVGLIVDEIEKVHAIDVEDIQTNGTAKQFTIGAIESAGKFIFVLDIHALAQCGYGIIKGLPNPSHTKVLNASGEHQ